MFDRRDLFRAMPASLLTAFSFGSFGKSSGTDSKNVTSSKIEYERIGTYDLARLKKILNEERQTEGFGTFPIDYPDSKNGVNLYRVRYRSVIPEKENRPTLASGLIAVPDTNAESYPLLSYQHGTTFGRSTCPSLPENSYETRLMVARFAGNGYVMIAPDYFGKGESTEPDSYTVRDSTRQACLDMLIASKQVLSELSVKTGKMFLTGWSQGGWSTMTYLHKLESLGIEVEAASTASAFNDLFASIQRWVLGYEKTDAEYIPACYTLHLFACEYYHDLKGLTAWAIRPEYLAAAKAFYRGESEYAAFRSSTTGNVVDYLSTEFIEAMALGTGQYFDVVRDAEAYRWRRKTPLHSVFGQIDEACRPYVAKLPANYRSIVGGAESEAIDAGSKADHRGTFLYAVNHQKDWFDKRLS
jgi:pimeloyl-ACP methyl ester carboxylesterase